jgi:ribosomal protein S1
MITIEPVVNSSVKHPSQVFKVGDHLEAVVLIDITRGSRVVLGALENEEIDK